MKYALPAIGGCLILAGYLAFNGQKVAESPPGADAPPPQTKSLASVRELRPPLPSDEPDPVPFTTDANAPFTEQNGRLLFNQRASVLRNDPSDPEQIHSFARELGTVELAPIVELDHLMVILDTYRSVADRGHFPTGFNYEITNALLGDNRGKLALISADSSRINSEGELVDQWGTPFFFHNESDTNITIRSAGPDLKLYTEDDFVSIPAES